MSEDNVVLDHVKEFTDDQMAIVHHDINQQHGAVVWTKLGELISKLADSSSLSNDEARFEYCKTELEWIENSILEQRELYGEVVRNPKTGKFVRSRVSHNSTYRSNKSVLLNAVKEGVAIKQGDDIVPKSKLEKTVADTKEQIVVSPYDRACTYITKLQVAYGELHDSQRADITQKLRDGGFFDDH